METLFHYCSTEALLSIVSTRTIRLSALELANDSLEGKMVSAAMGRLAKADGMGFREAAKLVDLTSNLEYYYSGYGFCLSEEGDQLGQWRGYADDARGFSIGFSRKYLELLMEKNKLAIGGELMKLHYDEKTHDERVHPTYLKVKKYISEGAFDRDGLHGHLDVPYGQPIEAIPNPDPAIHAYNELCFALLDLCFELHRLKYSAFREEREWRVVSPHHNFTGPGLEHRSNQDRIIPYLLLELEELETAAITDLTLGPKNTSSELVLKGLLEQSGFDDVRIAHSSVSYR